MEAKIALLAFPQRFENGRLSFNVLCLPRNIDPLTPHPDLAPAPAWANAVLRLRACVLPGLAEYPRLDLRTPDNTYELLEAALPEAATIFTTLQERFEIVPGKTAADEKPTYTRKYLTESYRSAFHFTQPRSPHAALDDSYECALKKEDKPIPDFVEDNNQVSWGQVFAFCLRQPALAKKCGFIHEMAIDLTPEALTEGGWLFVDFAVGAHFDTADPTAVIRYAARLPKVAAGTTRNLFAPVLFPVRHNTIDPFPNNPKAPFAYDDMIVEASMYDDGFAKIVHAAQPVSDHLLKEKRDPEFPVTADAGIRLGWDDEQLLTWMNRQLEEDPGTPGQRADAPLGVFGYRIDARLQSPDPNASNPWTSLCRIQNKAELRLGPTSIGDLNADGELQVEVYPSIPDGDKNKHYWLPAFFAYWTGKSLVLQDEDAIDLFRKEENTQKKNNTTLQASKNTFYAPVGLDAVPLRYGEAYEFRVRLADLTGGGPDVTDEARYAGEAPIARQLFRRYAVPQIARLLNDLPQGDNYFPDESLRVMRPRLGYPSVLFTGAYPDAIDRLKADFDAAHGKRDIGISDPDVDRLHIEIAVRALDMDTTLPKHRPQDHFAILYSTTRAFPANLDEVLEIPLTFLDRPVLNFNGQKSLFLLGLADDDDNIDNRTDLVLPTNRDIQITIRPLCVEKPDYYADNEALAGMTTRFVVRRAPQVETDIFKATNEQTRIRGLYLRRPEEKKLAADWKTVLLGGHASPDQPPTLIERLGQAIDVDTKGLSLVGKPGRRWQFGAARAIRHTLAPDSSSLTLATQDDLINHWIVPITLLLNRDWSWDGAKPTSIDILRRKKFALAPDWETPDFEVIGDIELKRAINIQALTDSDRSQTFLCFLDAIEPKAADPDAHPDEVIAEYRIVFNFKEDNPDLVIDAPLDLSLRLPITTPPGQIPRVVSAGMALSRYMRDTAYSNTEARQRYLWVEFEESVRNPRDAYFARITAYAPDPLLAVWTPDWMEPRKPPALPIEPEYLRLITPGHSDDRAGLDAMQQLIPATDSDRHFLVPLPPGLHPEAPELFGFFTYEFRIGHRDGWSTAQGRFGRALECQGVQHPLPQLFCSPDRNDKQLRVTAPHAQAVFEGRVVTSKPPRTQLWALLYAQARMADGTDNRNILLQDRLMRRVPARIYDDAGTLVYTSENGDAPTQSMATWTNAEISALLRRQGLPTDSPVSVVCVEMMPTHDQFLVNPHIDVNNADMMLSSRNPYTTEPARTRQELQIRADQMNRTHNAYHQALDAEAEDYEAQLANRPLSDDLGYFRLLRTSPLAAAPTVCCVDC